MGDRKTDEVVVVMVPFLAQGHLNQLLHLSRLVSTYNVPVHFVTTTTHARQAKLRIHGWDPLSVSNIHFHELPSPAFDSPPPNPYSSSAFPSHLQPAFETSLQLREPFAEFLHSLSPLATRIVVIHDSLMSYSVQDVVSVANAESYIFRCASVFTTFSFFWERMGRPFDIGFQDDLPSSEGCFTPEFGSFVTLQRPYQKFHTGILYDSSRVIEGKFIEFLEREETSERKIHHWAIGPFNPVKISKETKNRHKILEWLDKQEDNSVIYVSFGTTTSLKYEQIVELANGLEKSEQKFIWVLRDADTADVFGNKAQRVELPKGYEERVAKEGNGLIVREWAPQTEILGHSATGGFMSHCGWNSSMESITMGVPIAAWPMHSDQPRNAFLIANVLKIGLVVRDWARREELVTSSAVETAVRKLMNSHEGDDIRKRAEELGCEVRRSVAEGGITRKELDSFISHITRL